MLVQDPGNDLLEIVRLCTVDLYQRPSGLAQACSDLPRYSGLPQALIHAKFEENLEHRLPCMPI